ncbi:MAG: hypothetical protein A4E52_01083 [Pelotomaculum sp. PtaB.Bin013]|uniref:DUF4418 family protein n=1 Tax=Pelotomaculum isophthalicicum JI TaxID=947010 RepID=A0A9X4JUX1_9FIRM|nr:DUF4418 family protein [Pelotomaculum isophthalicicum]MDF9410000.1 DUF4418 family protein [Pelotomaculum isophthalicicum JI]OPX89179.1 MAG: hypothetical protein A4E52_01083 [Pelotomaculum sp. PtaB.Bin013]
MKKNLSKLILGTELLASLLILGSIFIWAPVCDGLLTLQNGTMVHMKCFYTGQVSIVLAIILLFAAIVAFFSKTDHNKLQWVIIVIGIMIIANTFESVIGIGICKNTAMACHATSAWLRGSGVLVIISGLFDIFANSSKTNKLTL